MKFDYIFKPGQIGSLHLKNRVIMAPMNVGGNNQSDGCLSQRGIDYFVERAKGGTGMIVTGAVRVTRKFERDSSTIPLWMLFADHMVHTKWMSELAERCHDYGTKVCIQLTAGGGRIAGAYAQNNGLAIGPSEISCFYPPHKKTRQITKEEINDYINAFEQTARFVKNAGADAIQLHGHQGYMLDQFSCSLWNKRTDEYGGSLENRLRFAKEIIEAIKRGAGKNFPIIYRYGLTHYLDGGRTIEEGVQMAKLLETYGVDALDIDSGCYENNYYPHPPESIPCGSFSYLAEIVRKEVNIPIITSTRIGYPDVAEKVLSDGQADFVCLGRPLIADPYWCIKALEGKDQEIRPCIACHEGCLRRLFFYKPLSCAVNPLAGNEEYLKIRPAEEKKKIAVVGGGVAGIVSAITLSKRGHTISLYEKCNELGGNFKSENVPDFKEDYKRYVAYLKYQLQKTSVSIHLGVTIKDNDPTLADFDKVVWAVGARFKTMPIDGLDNELLTSPFALYQNRDFTGKRVLIIGGGLVGVEAALNVKNFGGVPIIVELSPNVCSSAYSVNRQHLELLLKEKGIQIFTKTYVAKIDGNKAYCKTEDCEFIIEFDIITEAIGMISNPSFANSHDIIVGDADHPENVMNAVWTAYRQCRLI